MAFVKVDGVAHQSDQAASAFSQDTRITLGVVAGSGFLYRRRSTVCKLGHWAGGEIILALGTFANNSPARYDSEARRKCSLRVYPADVELARSRAVDSKT